MRLPALLCLLLLSALAASASTDGKVVGRVTGPGGPLAGANVRLLEPALGAATDVDGRFLLLRVPPGQRRLVVSHLGYRSVEVDVLAIAGQTQDVAVELEPGAIEGEELRVVAARHPLPVDRTGRMAVIGGERLQDLPVDGVDELLAVEAGLTRDDQGRLHVRGGRAGELKYRIDGVDVADPVGGGFEGLVSEDAISQLVLVAGTFDAEYGDAMSGVVNIVTRKGGETPRASLRWRSPELLGSPWRESSPFGGVRDEEDWKDRPVGDRSDGDAARLRLPVPGRLNLALSGPLGGGLRAALSTSSRYEDGPLPHGYVSEGDGLLTLSHGLGAAWTAELTLQSSQREWQDYAHAWKYLPENQASQRRGVRRASLALTHELSPRLYYTLRAALQRSTRFTGVLRDGDPLPEEDYRQPLYRVEGDFYQAGHSSTLVDDSSDRLQLKIDLTAQPDRVQELKGGLEAVRVDASSRTVHNVWGDRERFDDRWSASPLQLGAYVQDHLDFEMLALNLGLRFDWRDPDADWWAEPTRPFVAGSAEGTLAPLESVAPQQAVSPRLGLAFPLDESTALHASYGHFLQFAPLEALYGNRERNLDYSSVPLFGNPRVRPQRTVAWEIGVVRETAGGGQLSATAWYKDLSDLLSTVEVLQYSRQLAVYGNTDYANVRGLDLSWAFPLGGSGSLELDYAWMSARGSAAEPTSGRVTIQNGEEIQFNEFPLDYEQSHDFAASLELELPRRVQLDVLCEAGSGLPYTPFFDIGTTLPTNSANRPWTWRVDAVLRWRKAFGFDPLELWVEGDNLLDRRNVVQVYPSTGDPFEDPRGLIGSTPDALHNPAHVDAPRALRLGLQLEW